MRPKLAKPCYINDLRAREGVLRGSRTYFGCLHLPRACDIYRNKLERPGRTRIDPCHGRKITSTYGSSGDPLLLACAGQPCGSRRPPVEHAGMGRDGCVDGLAGPARGAPARSDALLGIDVDRDGPEPAQIWQGLAVLVDAPHSAIVLNDYVIDQVAVGWR